MTWAGVDPGERRIGVSRSDPLGMLAHPRAVVPDVPTLVRLLGEWVASEDLEGVVVGLPRNMDGSLGPIARRSLALVRELRRDLALVVRLWDERLTTRQVERTRGGGRRGQVVDDQVAALLLQSFLDAGTPDVADPPEYLETD